MKESSAGGGSTRTSNICSNLLVISVLFFVGLAVYVNKVLDVRVYDLERQDKSQEEGKYSLEEYTELMHLLSENNLVDNYGHKATLKYGFDKLQEPPNSILEIGFGLGNFSIILSQKYPNSEVVGIDSHEHSVFVANKYLNNRRMQHNADAEGRRGIFDNVKLEYREDPRLREPTKSFDIITSTFVNHHIFPDDEFVNFLQHVSRVGRKYFIFNDFQRTPFCIAANYLLFSSFRTFGADSILALAGRLFHGDDNIETYKETLRSNRWLAGSLSLLYDGGILSMRRSFSMEEYSAMFRAAGYPAGSLKCESMFNYADPVSYTCRIVCVVDLSWNNIS